MAEKNIFNPAPPFLVVTDLDGTLLDHNNYSWRGAEPALKKLRSLNIPVIFNTSKSVKEVLFLQKQMAISTAFIVENGSALYIPSHVAKTVFTQQSQEAALFNSSLTEDYYYLLFGEHRKKIIDTIHKARTQHSWHFEGFADWTIKDVMKLTNLDENSARQALDRQYSEPLLWQDSETAFKSFTSYLQTKQLNILSGGRFYHVIGQTNKAKPILYLRQTLYRHPGTKVICLGDSANDIDMLEVADFPVCVRSPVREFPVLDQEKAYYTNNYGPKGWSEAIEKILEENLFSGKNTDRGISDTETEHNA